jgi:hypothetical protein
MAVADWIFVSTSSSTNTALAYAPAGVVPAPTGGQSYGRILTGPFDSIAGFYPSAAALSNIPYSPNPAAIRINCLVYFTGTDSRNFAISAKNIISSPEQFQGYSVGLNYGSIRLSLNNNQTFLQGTPAINTWLSWRLSVYPISPTIDRIIAEFESSPGSGVWSSTWPLASGDITVESGVGSRYIAWGGTNRRNGVFSNHLGSNTPIYIDLLQVSLATPPPIP